MSENQTKGEMHGCIVCGRLYQLYVVYDPHGKYIGSKVMTPGGHLVPNPSRPLVACDRHSEKEVSAAVERAYGERAEQDD
ncbi:MAG TPA: hypothetical protein VMJ64_03265 [Anaerolineales bacterium]|nr:hypothetical protein [Anaerolineales bacterium]